VNLLAVVNNHLNRTAPSTVGRNEKEDKCNAIKYSDLCRLFEKIQGTRFNSFDVGTRIPAVSLDAEEVKSELKKCKIKGKHFLIYVTDKVVNDCNKREEYAKQKRVLFIDDSNRDHFMGKQLSILLQLNTSSNIHNKC